MDHADTNGLDLAPFRGLRYDPAKVGDLALVTSPPYDVVEPGGIGLLEDADPHNIVRVVLPRADACGAEGPYAHAGVTLRTWLAEGVLRPDPVPALYVYEQTTATAHQRGLIGALALGGPDHTPATASEGAAPDPGADGTGVIPAARNPHPAVLPHEDVMPGPVADRTELMRATQANPEPILLAYSGDGPASDAVDRAAAAGPPLLDTRTPDGTEHRLWAITDPAQLAAIDADLRTRRALIADGHHRWAGYRRLRDDAYALGRGAGPWDRGLVLLVDTARYPLQVGAIHRVVPGLSVDAALDGLRTHGPAGSGAFLARRVDDPWPSVLWTLERAEGPAYLLTGDSAFHLLTDPDPDLLADAVPYDRPAAWRALDATVLHAALLDRVWRVPDDPTHITYHHDAVAAIREAQRTHGTALLLRPVTEGIVRELAEQGVRMPRKSTSFGPKPATGLVLRSLALD
ncbi:DUF1015 domain-containing protein [Yinghuangia seranimata]|uniref:DUF1015 domain-containing protein n=1 Tax=Yinghuangia seranimata TaxID=408067 RepID=UPI00248B4BBB|nr:DUF1015 domain-containing protein [Yinghuangia seranimata]MDI2131849.1 DUF1015 domain-containing protein [Yinghuangia seranimata]